MHRFKKGTAKNVNLLFNYTSILFCMILYLLMINVCQAHEPWLLTTSEMNYFKQQPSPIIFTQLTPLTSFIIGLSILGVVCWILFNKYIFKPQYTSLTDKKIYWSILALRVGTGVMLILSGLGLLPKIDIEHFQEPTLLSPDLLLRQFGVPGLFLAGAEVVVGILLLAGFYIRVLSVALFLLLLIAFILFGKDTLQYAGFYLGIISFLFTQGDAYKRRISKKYQLSANHSLLLLRCLTGANFIYSALSIKLAHPNLDIAILEKTQAITFGIPFDYFTFLMLIVELTFGALIIIGYRLRIISIFLLLLFTILAINFGENILAHSFIYGILFVFLICG